ncbi:MAG: hypothetical protein LN417_00005 [Candidatus Thermoplasmatota archaeon]|nr:hypothetical protein [Candidatus Thermoplasmatota archaeon]
MLHKNENNKHIAFPPSPLHTRYIISVIKKKMKDINTSDPTRMPSRKAKLINTLLLFLNGTSSSP